jgi:glycosyltransferase involved in cell wall biosynthesis
MRLLVVSNLYPPQELGGYGRSIYDFANVLRNRGHELLVLTANLPEWQRGSEPEPDVSRTLKLWGNWGPHAKQVTQDVVLQTILGNHRKLADAVREFDPAACLVGNIDYLSPFTLHVLAAQGVGAIHHLGNRVPGYEHANFPPKPFYHLATASNWVKKALLSDGYPVEDASVIYPGAHVSMFMNNPFPERDKLRIAYASLVMAYKGPHILLEALGILHKRGIPFECSIAGDSAEPDFVAKLKTWVTQNRLDDKIKFLGFLFRPRLIELFKTHNVLAFPSVFEEPFGISQVEAMAAGMALVSSATGGASEIVEDGVAALAFKNQDAASMAAAFIRLHEDRELWKRICEGGRERAVTKFNIETSVTQLEEQFERLAKFRRKPSPRDAVLVGA